MRVGYFRHLRRKRVVRLDEDLEFGVKRVMHNRWDLPFLIEVYQNFEELESLIQKNKIVEEDTRAEILQDIQEIKKDYPLTKPRLPSWDVNDFLSELLWLQGEINKVMLMPTPGNIPIERARQILDTVAMLVQKRREKINTEEERLTTFIVIASKKHIYWMQLVINITLVVVGIVIGWIFSR